MWHQTFDQLFGRAAHISSGTRHTFSTLHRHLFFGGLRLGGSDLFDLGVIEEQGRWEVVALCDEPAVFIPVDAVHDLGLYLTDGQDLVDRLANRAFLDLPLGFLDGARKTECDLRTL